MAREESTGTVRAVGAACAAPLPACVDGPVVVFPAKSHTFITPDKAAAALWERSTRSVVAGGADVAAFPPFRPRPAALSCSATEFRFLNAYG